MEFGPHILISDECDHHTATHNNLAILIMDALEETHADIMNTETCDITCPYDAVIRLHGWNPTDYVFLYPLSAECAARAIRSVTPNHWSTEDDIIRILEDYSDWTHRFDLGDI